MVFKTKKNIEFNTMTHTEKIETFNRIHASLRERNFNCP